MSVPMCWYTCIWVCVCVCVCVYVCVCRTILTPDWGKQPGAKSNQIWYVWVPQLGTAEGLTHTNRNSKCSFSARRLRRDRGEQNDSLLHIYSNRFYLFMYPLSFLARTLSHLRGKEKEHVTCLQDNGRLFLSLHFLVSHVDIGRVV